MATDKVRRSLQTVLKQHKKQVDDEDMLEYMINMIADPDADLLSDAKAISEGPGQFLLSLGLCDDDREVLAICKDLVKVLAAAAADVVAAAKKSSKLFNDVTVLKKAVVIPKAETTKAKSSGVYFASQLQQHYDDVVTGSKADKRRKARYTEALRLQAERAVEGLANSFVFDDGSDDDDEPVEYTDVKLASFNLPSRGDGGDLLTDADLTLSMGRRYGLVGLNGCGKSTLMHALATKSIKGLPPARSILHVKQQVLGDSRPPLNWLMEANGKIASLRDRITDLDKAIKATAVQERERATSHIVNKRAGRRRRNLKKKKKTGPDPRLAKLDELQVDLLAMEDIKGQRGRDALKILKGLGFSDDIARNTQTKMLSGGWRMRVALAAALFVRPSILLLDEPTNHLDLEAVIWLENYIRSELDSHQILVVVSHDKHFLNEICTDICHFRGSTLKTYKGDFFTFEKVQEEHRVRQQRQREAQEMKRKHLETFIRKHAELGSNGVKASKQRKSRMKKLKRLGAEAEATNMGRRFKASYDGDAQDVEAVIDEAEVVLNFPDPGPVHGSVLRMDGVSFAYPPRNEKTKTTPATSAAKASTAAGSASPPPVPKSRHIFRHVDFGMKMGDRAALVGRNGAGKSTLLKLITGQLNPTKGRVALTSKARIAYIAQHQVEQLDLLSTPLDIMLKAFPGDRSDDHTQHMRSYLGGFGLGGVSLPFQPVATLSGGQKCRLCLALTLYTKPHVIIMDEPTNHLDVETVNALTKAIENFPGSVVIVSHDQYLLECTEANLYVVGDGKVVRFDKPFADYKAMVLADTRKATPV